MMVSIRPALSADSYPLGATDDEPLLRPLPELRGALPRHVATRFGVLVPAGVLARRLLGCCLSLIISKGACACYDVEAVETSEKTSICVLTQLFGSSKLLLVGSVRATKGRTPYPV